MPFRQIDLGLFLPAVLLSTLGTIILSSVSPHSFPGQFVYLGLAIFIFLFFSAIDIKILKSFSVFFYIFSILLLTATMLFGVFSRGSVRWIDLGFITIQPSEIVKPALLLFFSSIIANRGQSRFFTATAFMLPSAALVFIQPDLGSSLVIVAGFLGVIFMGGIPLRLMILGAVLALVVSPLAWTVMADYQKDRVKTYLQPSADPLGSGYNSIQSVISIGSGGVAGRGLGQGTQSQLLFLPERHTDFVFAALSEELGFVGSGLLVVAFGILLTRLIFLLKDENDDFIRALMGGTFVMIFAQASINIGMNLGILPVTGIPLPFVSSGGSSLIAMSAALGIASSASSSLKARLGSGII